MRHVSVALVAAAVLAGTARADGPVLSLTVRTSAVRVMPSGSRVAITITGTNPGGAEKLYAFLHHGRAGCAATPEEEKGTVLASGESFGEQFGLSIDLRPRNVLGAYRACAHLGSKTAGAYFGIGPPALEKLRMKVTERRGKSARKPGATVFRLHASRSARADVRVRWANGTTSRMRTTLGRFGRGSLRVPWSCTRPGLQHYKVIVRDRYRNARAHRGAFRSESCVGLPGFFIWPLRGRINSYFGYAERGRLHDGIDIDDNLSSTIRAAAWGRVTSAGWSAGYGLMTVIDHGEGFVTFYGHQSSIRVHYGQRVRRGQVIGIVGCTGSCTGTHLHFGMHVHGAPVNPLRYL